MDKSSTDHRKFCRANYTQTSSPPADSAWWTSFSSGAHATWPTARAEASSPLPFMPVLSTYTIAPESLHESELGCFAYTHPKPRLAVETAPTVHKIVKISLERSLGPSLGLLAGISNASQEAYRIPSPSLQKMSASFSTNLVASPTRTWLNSIATSSRPHIFTRHAAEPLR